MFDATGLTHPLLPAGKAVRNDVKLGDELQLMILSGPNMAGKSTFIRSIGVNAVLAQCGAPVRAGAEAFAAGRGCIDLHSRFALGRCFAFLCGDSQDQACRDLAAGSVPVLFLLDELLSGTNSHDRLEGTKFVVQQPGGTRRNRHREHA